MKKIYLLLTLLLVFASCSEWKYSKGAKWEQPQRYKLSKATEQPQAVAISEKDEPVEENIFPEEKSSTKATAEAPETETAPLSPDVEQLTVIDRDDDTVYVATPEATRIAFNAEDNGRRSRNMGITGLALTLTYILAFVGLVFSIIGLIYGIKSLKASYNTPKGVKMARTGVITSSIVIGLYILSIIVLVLILVAFL